MLSLFKTNTGTEFLAYSDNKMEFAEELKIELIEENVDLLKYMDYPILDYDQLIQRIFLKTRTPDKILSDEKIETYRDLQESYFLLMHKSLNKPKKIRDLVKQKYDSIIQYVNLPDNKAC